MANNFHLTEEQAIRQCKAMWKKIKEAKWTKDDFLDNNDSSVIWNYSCKCPLCQWTREYRNDNNFMEVHPQTVDLRLDCHLVNRVCPLISQYGKSCYQLGFNEYGKLYTEEWFKAIENLKENKGES